MMSGIKLTVLLPTLDHLLRSVIMNVRDEQSSKMHYLLVLCHSTVRCSELEDFLKQLTVFCQDVVEVVGLYAGDNAENTITLKKSMNIVNAGNDMKSLYKARCKVIVSTPN